MSSHATTSISGVHASAASEGRVERHKTIDRIYHWSMAACILTLMATAFLPIEGYKFAWLTIHWIAGLILTALVLFHIVRALFFQSLMTMVPTLSDVRAYFSVSVLVPGGKYNLMQKLYHLAVIGLVFGAIGSGIAMLTRIDTPFWRRNPFWLSLHDWGLIYALHDFMAMCLVTMVMIHIYFGIRPDEWPVTKSMFWGGWISRKAYREHFDPTRWKGEELK